MTYNQSYYASHKNKILSSLKTRIAPKLAFIKAYKESKPCQDCGGWFPAHVMDFDHVRGSKRRNISAIPYKGSKEFLYKEIQKCELVCANCHRMRTHQRNALCGI